MQELKLLRVLNFFINNPYEEVYLRELAKKLRISPFAIKKYVELLLKEKLILDERKANLRYFKANINNLFFRYLKISMNIGVLLKTGIVEFLKEDIANLSSVVLFGSMAKGEDDDKSDVDLLIIGKEKYLDLKKFEKSMDKEITLHIFSWGNWNKKARENSAFYFEVISQGVALYGELPILKWK